MHWQIMDKMNGTERRKILKIISFDVSSPINSLTYEVLMRYMCIYHHYLELGVSGAVQQQE
jgi:hypothetical protein